MNRNHAWLVAGFAALSSGMAGCAPTPSAAEAAAKPAAIVASAVESQAPANHAPATEATAQAEWPIVLVHKTPTCGCCGAWVEHMRHAGFTVEVDERDDLEPIRKQLGVPYGKGSCHTAEVGGYVVEGHVPAEDVKRLLAERPKARGLVVPGMPMGSPGMESPDGRVQPYTVELIGMEGATSAFARHGE